MERSGSDRPVRKPARGSASRRQVLHGTVGGAVAAGLAALSGAGELEAGASSAPVRGAPPATQPMGEATEATRAANAQVLQQLPFADTSDFDLASRGLIEATPDVVIRGPRGLPVWNMPDYAFLTGDAPATVNPSLWRNALLNMHIGLFQVTDGVYQVRGYDISNITLIETSNGVIAVDPLASVETAEAALALYYKHRPQRPIVAVIYTHSHVDHYGGVKGIVSDADVTAGRVQIIAPDGFLEHAVSENVLAGNAMGRRASYMYGSVVTKGPAAQVDAGLGKTVSSGTTSLIAPTVTIERTGQELTIDGVRLVFQLTPGTEAPAEMNFHLPQLRALCAAENATPTLHNLYTLRGAQVRDALVWSYYLGETIRLYGDQSDVLFASHFWPRWGRDAIAQFLTSQADLYKYLHDQTLRLANHGYTMTEIAEMVELPASLAQTFYNRSYYGTVNHDAKAVYQRYLGWFDGNPAHLHSLPPQEAGRRYVEFMGGAAAVIARARRSFEEGDYRWVAEVMSHVVFAEPENVAARALEAAALEQLGFQAESGPWRNFYMVGAAELRRGVPRFLPGPALVSPDVAAAMTTEMLFDYMGVRLNGPKAAGQQMTFNIVLTDAPQPYVLRLRNAALSYDANATSSTADATITLARAALTDLALGAATLEQQVVAGQARVTGDQGKLSTLLALLDTFEFWFDIVTP